MRRGVLRAGLLVAAASSLGVQRPPGLADVETVRHWSYPNYTRIVVELTRNTETAVRRLPANRGARLPERLYFDLPGVWVGRDYPEPIPVADGLLRRVRVGQNTLTHTRIVLDLERYERHRLLHLSGPPRVVIDVFGERARMSGTLRDEDDEARRPLPPELRPVQHVVVDPGHGGRDPGAIGIGGLREKDVTLDVSRRLRSRLGARGFRVTLTREDDRSLDLEERTALAEGAGGDVFVSVHANAATRRGVQGIEIYTLDEDAQRQTLRLAARENGVRPREVNPLQRLLARLRVSEASARSSLLATLVNREIAAGMGKRWPSARDPALKKGPFYVLYLSSMPSILVEVGFLTHREEARRLRDPHYLDALAEEIADGLAGYRGRFVPVVAGRSP